METPRWKVRECSVRLRRCDGDHKSPRAKKDDFTVDTEDKTSEATIKQELDITSTDLQMRVVSHFQQSAAEACPPAHDPDMNVDKGTIPSSFDTAAVQSAPGVKMESHRCEDDCKELVTFDSSCIVNMNTTDCAIEMFQKQTCISTRNEREDHSNSSVLSNCKTYGRGPLQKYMSVHEITKPYKCKQCVYSTSRLNNLQTHMRTHTGEKPYSCGHCEYNASDRSTLRRHIRKHTGEKPYSCEQCDYSTYNVSCLPRHMRKHTGEKPYKCNQCDYRASHLYSLKLHTRKHTGKKLS